MECPGQYTLLNPDGSIVEQKEAILTLEEETLSIFPKLGDSLLIPYRDIVTVTEKEYKLYLDLPSQDTILITHLGYKHEDFLRILSRLRNELLLKDQLMNETLRKSGVEAEVEWKTPEGKIMVKGKTELRLYETALVLIPYKGELVRLPYSFFEGIQPGNYTIEITLDSGDTIILGKMGNQFDPFLKTFSDLMNELSLKVQTYLKELIPGANPLVLRKVARFMKEGKAARRKDIEGVDPSLWREIEKRLFAIGLQESYEFLTTLGQKNQVCIGLKRGLLGDLTGEYLWFLIPIYNEDSTKAGNAVAMEAGSTEGGGRATYFFKIVDRSLYRSALSLEELKSRVDTFIRKLNHCMLAINFRREPIYLTDEKLQEPTYRKYQYAIAKIPELRELRKLFIGRVIHSSSEQWQNDIMDLLTFNVSTQEETARWSKKESGEIKEETV
ncbi:MAG: hypothetical protein SNJ78_02520 [Spirochaetales bacterium]